ncbi:MAG: hypothetical protein QOE90_3686 [Thermoplasmata archaeon]|jgi:hypothetical protein|nr:hypothetical protein [Thermoplasmata archaeon]
MLRRIACALLVASFGLAFLVPADAVGVSVYVGQGPGTLTTDFGRNCGNVTVALSIRAIGAPEENRWEFREVETDPTCVASHSEWTATGSPQEGWHFVRVQPCTTIDTTVGPISAHTAYADAIEDRCNGAPTHRYVNATLDFGPFV